MTRLRVGGLAVVLAVASWSPTLVGQGGRPIESFTALAIQPGAPPGLMTVNIEIAINRWSTAAERDTLMTTLREQPSKVLDVLQKMPSVGRLRAPGSIGYDLRYAERSMYGGTERLLLLTDRPMGFDEASAQSRTMDYPITLIEMRIQPNGQGEGKVAVAAKLGIDRGSEIMIESWNFSPVELRSVRRNR